MYKRNIYQNWAIGNIVCIGFLHLRVIDNTQKEYFLESLNGHIKYKFTPYKGLFRIKQQYKICLKQVEN
jgi:hypothetical protein